MHLIQVPSVSNEFLAEVAFFLGELLSYLVEFQLYDLIHWEAFTRYVYPRISFFPFEVFLGVRVLGAPDVLLGFSISSILCSFRICSSFSFLSLMVDWFTGRTIQLVGWGQGGIRSFLL